MIKSRFHAASLALLLCFLASIGIPAAAHSADQSWTKTADSVIVPLAQGALRLQPVSARVIRVTFGPTGTFPAPPVAAVIGGRTALRWTAKQVGNTVKIATGVIAAVVNVQTGSVRFLDPRGATFLSEPDTSPRSASPVTIAGTNTPDVQTYHVSQQFDLSPGEAIYGLGQHQAGMMSYVGTTTHLEQTNREVALPIVISSRGYGVIWNCPAATNISVGTLPAEAIPSSDMISADGIPGGLTGDYYTGQNFDTKVLSRVDSKINLLLPKASTDGPVPGVGHDNFSIRWTGQVVAPDGGPYSFVTHSDDGVRLWIDGKLLIDDWNVHPEKVDSGNVTFAAGSKHDIKMEYFQNTFDAVASLEWSHGSSNRVTTIDSEAANTIDYYAIYGPSIDGVVSGYRDLTGQAPMPGRWALGFWQCKERYQTQQEWIDIASKYRSLALPIDDIVQDWFYWDPFQWGSHKFDPKRYPDPAAGIAQLHDQYHMHFMISVWGKFAKGSDNYNDMTAKGFLYPALGGDQFYDAFNPAARSEYWRLMNTELFDKGVDGWWLDASEPELDMNQFRHTPTAAGIGALVLNAWPLMHTTSVYEGQRAATSQKRVYILTRSAYLGQQRNAAATWSGDITGNWATLREQIPAGLNFCISGIPYWTTDIGGFFPGDFPGGNSNEGYRELFTRWYEWGSFCPIFRVHGTGMAKEMWQFGPEHQAMLLRYDNLRYRLMPYIYSQAWKVTHEGSTIMRALVFDNQADPATYAITDEFQFGPSFLICPVTQPGAVTRSVYLPKTTKWYDFWTGKSFAGGQTVDANAPIDQMPIYVRAGSVVPMGPFLQYSNEKPEDPIELRIYPGANGDFNLYEDDGTTYDYEKGAYATIKLHWDDQAHVLTIGPRTGMFKGMETKRTINVVIVSPGHGTTENVEPKTDKTVNYTGQAIAVRM
jgi:alpha-D-xyloside xylohydrolase